MGKCDIFNFHRGSVLFAGVPVSTSEGAFFTYFLPGNSPGRVSPGHLDGTVKEESKRDIA